MKIGFTLVELLATIAVLSILLVIGTSSVAKVIKERKQTLYNEQIESFEESARLWSYKNTNLLPEDGNSLKLTLRELENAKFLKSGIKNPLTGEYFDKDEFVCIFNNNESYTYKYNGGC